MFGIDLPILLCLLIPPIMLGAFVILIWSAAANAAQDQRELQQFLARWGGKLEASDNGSGQIRLIVNRATLTIEYTERREDEQLLQFTHLSIPCSASLPRLEIRHQRPKNVLDYIFSPFPGNQDIQIGCPEFDDAFVIQGKDPERIREFLTADLQAAIVTLSRFESFGREDDLHLETYDGWLRITKHYRVRTDAELSQFVSYGTALVGLIQQQKSGIEFVAAGPPVPVKNTQCRVCGDPLGNQIVFCAKCRSPQHHDCWQYVRGCSVYGFGGQQFVANQRPLPAKMNEGSKQQ